MKTRLLLLLGLGVILSGCATSRTYRLPNITAEEIHVKHTDSFGSISADAVGVKVTDRTINAAEVRWQVSYPFWNDDVSVKNFTQKREESK